MKTKNSRKRKYNILSKLEQLPYKDYSIAKNRLPFVLKVSKRTFERWTYLFVDDKLEAPADKLAIVAKYFNCPLEELFNYPIPQYNTNQLKRLNTNQLAQELGLTI